MTEARARPRKKPRKPPIEREVRLLGMAARGAATATVDDRKALIDRGIPGEVVMATVDRRRSPWRGTADRVIEASPDRVVPPCEHYSQGCGGCQWQHVAYEAQLRWKRESVDREMASVGLPIQVSTVHGMDDPWRYRHTAALAIGWEAGFRPRGRRGIVEVHDCLISHPLVGHLSNQLNRMLRSGYFPNYHGKVWIEATVVGSQGNPALQLVLQGIGGLTPETHPEIPEIARHLMEIDAVFSVAYRHRTGEVRAVVGDLMSGVDVAGRLMYLPAGSFFQTNFTLLPILIERLRDLVKHCHARHVADIYGGVGTFALPLSEYADAMTLVELDVLAVEAARRTAADWNLNNVRFVSGHAERALPELEGLDLVVVDPPRSGLGDVVLDTLVKVAPQTLLYVSCAPPSLARDLATLAQSGYQIESLELFDFYPQTYHVESLAVLSR